MNGNRSKARILVVDDNLQTLKMLRFLLEDEGYDVLISSNNETAYEIIENPSNPIHLLLLDVMMAQANGFDLCAKIRRQGEGIPVIFISAKGDPSDRAEGLRAGADDYIVKPFDPGELLARIAAVLRRSKFVSAVTETTPVLRLGNVELDPGRLKVKVNNNHLADLTPTETKLLHCLMRNAGRVLTRDVLINQVWDYDYDGNNNTVDVYIRRLRQKVEPNPNDPIFIRTVRGVGYIFQAE